MRLLPLILVVFLTGCDETHVIYPPTYPTTNTGPNITNPIVPVPTGSHIEYRVTGNAISARIRYSNAVDGLTQVVTTLPYIATVNTSDSTMFLALDVLPQGYHEGQQNPYISAQIFANGVLFREASGIETLSISGTWRK